MSKFKAAAVFSSNMVLQRNAYVKIFGTGKSGDSVIAMINGVSAKAVIDNEKWTIVLPPMPAGGPYTLTITDGDTSYTFDNVMVGEVWLAGGQSNMELELQNCKGGKEVLATDKNPNVRYYYTQKNCYMDEKFFRDEENTGWSEFSEENARAWSAVGYFYAKELAAKLGVTVGVIGCNWGGTSASYWMSRESLERDIDTNEYLKEYDEAIAGKTEEQLKQEYIDYEKYHENWNKQYEILIKDNPKLSWAQAEEKLGKNMYPGPLCPLNPFHATALYDSMLKRVCPYTVKGFIYYQGETDDCRPNTYFKLFKNLIQLWRDDWQDDSLPFLFVQLPMHRYEADPDWKHWCIIREAQQRVFDTVKNTGMAVIIDCGEFNEIHPKDKVPVGHRLFLQAMYNVYGDKEISAFPPMYDKFYAKDDKITVYFKYSDMGYDVKGDLSGFEIAGSDKEFYPAVAAINEDNSITLTSDKVKQPLYARYLWTNYGEVPLYGKNGLPVPPFRTARV